MIIKTYFRKRIIFLSIFLLVLDSTNQPGLRASPVSDASCAGVGDAITKDQLVERGNQLILRRSTVEYSFESFALESIGLSPTPNTKKYTSLVREALTGGQYRNVQPDGVDTLLVYPVVDGIVQYPPVPYYESIFVDAKSVQGTIYPSSNGWQEIGYIDALQLSPVALVPLPPNLTAPPRMYWLTVEDTTISQDLLDLASGTTPVLMIQMVVCNNPGGTLGVDDLIMGREVLLNPQVLQGRSSPFDFVGQPGIAGSIGSPPPPPPPPPEPEPEPEPEPPACPYSYGCALDHLIHNDLASNFQPDSQFMNIWNTRESQLTLSTSSLSLSIKDSSGQTVQIHHPTIDLASQLIVESKPTPLDE